MNNNWNYVCKHILPLVYDDSLSYMELLCKLVRIINAMGENVKTLDTRIDTLEKNINNYLTTLDEKVKEQVNKMIEEMFADGYFDTLVTELVNKMNGFTKVTSTSDGAMQTIMTCVTSYVKHNKELAYITTQDGGNAWDYVNGVEQVTNDLNKTGFAIQCSAFAHLIMSGVPYEKSMYNKENGKVNHFGYAGYQYNMYGEPVTAENFSKYRFVRDMLPEFIKRGMAEPLAKDYSNIQAGDLIFFDSHDEKAPNTATHVGIAMSNPYMEYKENSEDAFILMAEAMNQYNPIRVAHVSHQRIKSRGAFYKVSIPWGSVPYQTGETIANMGGVTASNYISLNTDLQIYEPVTVSFDFTPTKIDSYVQIYPNNTSPTSGNILRSITKPLNAGDVGVTRHYSVPMSFYYSGADTLENPKITTLRVYSSNPADEEHNTITNLTVNRGWGSTPRSKYTTISNINQLMSTVYSDILSGVVNTHLWCTVCFDADTVITDSASASTTFTISQWRPIDVEYFIFRTSNSMNIIARFFYNNHLATIKKIGYANPVITVTDY